MCLKINFLLVCTLILCGYAVSDTIVQLNVNRPFNDVSEKFVSFAIKPEDLYDALDGPNRKSVTKMAALLGDSYVKFEGEYFFASNSERKLRNPTKIIWKGFNRWTRAVNWTMIIPVPYTPNDWDSMLALKILNSSYLVGITDCVWQLGTDFGTSRAKDYVQELDTLKLMVEPFAPYVDNWRVMGADISAGSSVEETKRYIEMSKNLNAAFGWTQPENMVPTTSLGSYIYESDPALRTLLAQRVPVWLTLSSASENSTPKANKRLVGDETTDALRWAQTLGDAASSGFDVVFKRMTLSDWESPTYSFYVTALFKKVMGSRVFPARPLSMFAPTNKLYTHCANAVSGGIAFMVVNTEDQPLTITVRSLNKLAGTEVWQYALSTDRGKVMLNNVKLSLNSTLRPTIRAKNQDKTLQLVTPTMSVSFWVLPGVNLEHCQFTEIEADEESKETSEERRKSRGYSSADRLLQKLIEESSVPRSAINRNRRFVLEDHNTEPRSFFEQLLHPFNLAPVPIAAAPAAPVIPKKRAAVVQQSVQPVRRRATLAWLRQVLEQSRGVGKSMSLKRGARSAENYSGPFFYNRNGKKSAVTRKITEIRRPEKKVKPIFDLSEFDEEEFFKKIDEHSEPEYVRPPEGDVHLKLIDPIDGEDEEGEIKPQKKKTTIKKALKIIDQSDEVNDEREKKQSGGHLIPTEFYESLPSSVFKPHKAPINIGAALNTLLFPEPFSKKSIIKDKPQPNKQVSNTEESDPEVEGIGRSRFSKSGSNPFARDFMQTQKELGKTFLSHIAQPENDQSPGNSVEITTEATQEVPENLKHGKVVEYLNDKIENYFKEDDADTAVKSHANKSVEKKKNNDKTDQPKSWWDLSSIRRKRALAFDISENALRSNMIDKEEELLPLGQVLPEQRHGYFEYHVMRSTETVPITISPKSDKIPEEQKQKGPTFTNKLMAAVKSKVSKFVNIITRHVNEWYTTFTKHPEDSDTNAITPLSPATVIDMTTMGNYIQ